MKIYRTTLSEVRKLMKEQEIGSVEQTNFKVNDEIDVLDGSEKILGLAQTILRIIKPIGDPREQVKINKRTLAGLFRNLKIIVDECVLFIDANGW